MDYETEKKMRKAFDINKIDKSKPTGSYENPQVVGIPECSNILFYDRERNCWCLTDGLGNGWIR